jgi:hypothetical protein
LIFTLLLLVAYLHEPAKFNLRVFEALLGFLTLVSLWYLLLYIYGQPFYHGMAIVVVFHIILFSSRL